MKARSSFVQSGGFEHSRHTLTRMAAADGVDEWQASFEGSAQTDRDERPYARNWACDLLRAVSARGYGSANIVTQARGASCMMILTARHGLFVVRCSCEGFPTDDDRAYVEIVAPLINSLALASGSVGDKIHVCWVKVIFSSRYADSFTWRPDFGLALNECRTADEALDLLSWGGSLGAKMHCLVEEYYTRMRVPRCPSYSLEKSPYVFRPDCYWDGSEVTDQPAEQLVRHLASIPANSKLGAE